MGVPEAGVKALKNYKRPIRNRDVRAFLGTVSYYHRFIPSYAKWADPLIKALYKEAPNLIVWDDRLIDCFNHLISVLCSWSVLRLPMHDDHFILHTDASFQGVGIILSAVQGEMKRPVGYYSRALTQTKKNYTATEIKCLSIITVMDNSAIHLLGQPFTIITDHQAFEALQSSGKINACLFRWALALQTYNFKVKYRPGSIH